VFRLVMLFVSVAFLAAFVWFGVTVDLGDRTLFGHLRAIGSTKESQDLWRGTKAKVNDAIGIEKAREALKNGVKSDPKAPADKPAGPLSQASEKAGPPQDQIGAEDREAMRRLIGSARAESGAGPTAK
jgi:hypothetical protein